MEPTPFLICDASALLYWRSVGAGSGPPPRAMRAMRAPGNGNAGKPSPDRIAYFLRRYPALAREPLHLLVSSGEARLRCKGIRCFVHAGAFPSRSFSEIEKDIFVLSPELCFLRHASKLSLPHAAQLGLEFCGAYSLSAGETRSARKRAPITNTAFLKSYVENCTGERGIAEARRALRYVEDGSESPRETIVALLLDLPTRLGGCGDPPPKMNYAIPLPKNARKATGRRSLRCDLLWPEEKLAIEYDSDLHHTGSERIASDATRRAVLTHLGFEVVTVANRHMHNTAEFEMVARRVAHRLDRRFRPDRSWRANHIELRRQLLDPP